jgi:hypothetical protein
MNMDKMLNSFSKGIVSLTLLAFFVPAQASYMHAAAPRVGGSEVGSNVPVVGTVVYDVGGPFASGPARVEFSNYPVPYILATAESKRVNLFETTRTNSAYGEMRYTFDILAQPLQTVPVTFDGLFRFTINNASVGGGHYVYMSVFSATGYAGINALFGYGTTDVNSGSNGGFIDVNWTGSATQSAGRFFGGLPFTTDAQGRATGTVVLEAQAVANNAQGDGISTAYIDPRFEIDAYWLALNPGATLSITPGVGNEIAAVPEPSTVLTLLAGLVSLRSAVRRPYGG